MLWRRSFDVLPPSLNQEDERYPRNDPKYRDVPDSQIPLTESLKETIVRVQDYWDREIKPQILAGKNVVIAAHGNSLRALVKYLENLSNEEIVDVNIPTGTPLVYTLDENLKPVEKYYLGSDQKVEHKIRKAADPDKILE
ncbi:2,3-bisphosphoglycerate-dependent phosphoglycerate mutase [compost metagenome]